MKNFLNLYSIFSSKCHSIKSNLTYFPYVRGSFKNKTCITFPVSKSGLRNYQKKILSDCSLEDIFPHLIVKSSIATIAPYENTSTVISMLSRFLPSFTNNVVVMEKELPVGMVGAYEILNGLLKNHIVDFLESEVMYHMNKNLYFVNEKTRLFDMLKHMKKKDRDFAILRNHGTNFSTISARRLLEVGVLCETSRKVTDIQLRPIMTFSKDDSLKEVIVSMLKNKTDILVLENTALFINPQIIFEKISTNFDHVGGMGDFLEMKAGTLKLKVAKIISENFTIPEMCKVMLNMRYPFVMTVDKIITPYNMIHALGDR